MPLNKHAKVHEEVNLNLVPMIDVVSFILLALAILIMSMKKEASLDNLLKLPPVLHSGRQDSTQLQIYILPAKILRGGYIDRDSTGLVAFAGKGKPPDKCPRCSLTFRNAKAEYVSGTLLDQGGKKLLTLAAEMTNNPQAVEDKPPAYFCSRCNYEISPYLKLDEIPLVLKKKKKETVDMLVFAENGARLRNGTPPLTKAEEKAVADNLPLMIKADNYAFYGRILQVINMVKDTSVNIKKFTFVTDASASLEAQKHDQEKGADKKN
jgi:biopolymer transport protein ExbD